MKNFPLLDVNRLAFCDNETVYKEELNYYKQIKKYIFKKFVPVCIIISIIICGISSYIFYQWGYSNSNNIEQSSLNDNLVYITPNGTKYHKKSCTYVKNNSIAISINQAQSENYTPCSKCYK